MTNYSRLPMVKGERLKKLFSDPLWLFSFFSETSDYMEKSRNKSYRYWDV